MSLPSQPMDRGGTDFSNVPHQAVRNCVAHICQTRGFSKSERLKRFLSYTVERLLAGDLDSFKEYSIALAVFDRSPDYNPKIDAVVRVEARRLRSRLEQYYATEGLHDSIRINFRSGSYMPTIVCSQEQSVSAKPRPPGSHNTVVRWFAAAGSVAVIATVLATFRMSVHRSPPAEIVRLVRDSAASFDPAISRDGKMLAYASDQSGNIDIWLRPLDGGEPRRLTTDPAADTSPDFSSNSTQIVFRSERDSGGIYMIPVTAGLERLVAPVGRSPKFSPDGKWIAYWKGEEHHFEGKIFIVSSTGGKPMRVGADLPDAKWPVWSPDGKSLLVYGSREKPHAGGVVSGPTDAFLVPIDGNHASETGWAAALRRANIWSKGPVSWDGSTLQFSAVTSPPNDFSEMSQGVANVWQIRLSERSGRVEGELRRVTFGSALERDSVLQPGGGAVYVSRHYALSVFEAPTSRVGRPDETFRTSFSSPGSYVMPRISRNGSTLVALSDRTGSVDIWLKDLHTGEERAITSTTVSERAPLASTDGQWVYFGIREGPLYPMYKVSARGGAPQKVCADCGTVSDISPDDTYVLYHSGEPWSAYGLDLATGARAQITRHKYRTYSSRFSPDGKWISFLAETGDDQAPRRIFVAPFSPGHFIPESQWIPITDGLQRDFEAAWSDDGSSLYFLSDRDGNRCIWATRVDGHNKRPLGHPFPVLHLHRMSANILNSAPSNTFSISCGGGRLIFGAAELSSTMYRVESRK